MLIGESKKSKQQAFVLISFNFLKKKFVYKYMLFYTLKD